ncbi:MAG: DUF1858 domain-containing protein [Halanaerobiales bacterium]|nr:DUF1858 domain-containing protein [Halanaerobiales bacterium]
MKITKEMTIAGVLQAHPETVPVFQQFGMHCLGCLSATSESLEQAANVHGFDVEELLDALNKAVK